MSRFAFWVRASVAALGFGLAVFVYVVVRILPFSMAARRQLFARAMSHLCCRPLGLCIRIVGTERIMNHQPCIFASNHQSQIDYPILGRVYPGNALVMASQIGDWPVMGWLYRGSGSIALDRDVPVRAAAALASAQRSIREDGLSIWMFVEGTRGKVPGQLGRFKRGAFRLATSTGVPIVPVVVSPLKPYTDLRGRRLQPQEVVVHILDPVFAADSSEEGERQLRDTVRERMRDVLAAYEPREGELFPPGRASGKSPT